MLRNDPVLVERDGDRAALHGGRRPLAAAREDGGDRHSASGPRSDGASVGTSRMIPAAHASSPCLASIVACSPSPAPSRPAGPRAVSVAEVAEQHPQAERVLFAERCSGCHTLDVAGTQGSADKVRGRERTDGPNFNTRQETKAQVLYAIRNGGFSGAIMPENIVVGDDAEQVAEFLAKYAGTQAEAPPAPDAR